MDDTTSSIIQYLRSEDKMEKYVLYCKSNNQKIHSMIWAAHFSCKRRMGVLNRYFEETLKQQRETYLNDKRMILERTYLQLGIPSKFGLLDRSFLKKCGSTFKTCYANFDPKKKIPKWSKSGNYKFKKNEDNSEHPTANVYSNSDSNSDISSSSNVFDSRKRKGPFKIWKSKNEKLLLQETIEWNYSSSESDDGGLIAYGGLSEQKDLNSSPIDIANLFRISNLKDVEEDNCDIEPRQVDEYDDDENNLEDDLVRAFGDIGTEHHSYPVPTLAEEKEKECDTLIANEFNDEGNERHSYPMPIPAEEEWNGNTLQTRITSELEDETSEDDYEEEVVEKRGNTFDALIASEIDDEANKSDSEEEVEDKLENTFDALIASEFQDEFIEEVEERQKTNFEAFNASEFEDETNEGEFCPVFEHEECPGNDFETFVSSSLEDESNESDSSEHEEVVVWDENDVDTFNAWLLENRVINHDLPKIGQQDCQNQEYDGGEEGVQDETHNDDVDTRMDGIEEMQQTEEIPTTAPTEDNSQSVSTFNNINVKKGLFGLDDDLTEPSTPETFTECIEPDEPYSPFTKQQPETEGMTRLTELLTRIRTSRSDFSQEMESCNIEQDAMEVDDATLKADTVAFNLVPTINSQNNSQELFKDSPSPSASATPSTEILSSSDFHARTSYTESDKSCSMIQSNESSEKQLNDFKSPSSYPEDSLEHFKRSFYPPVSSGSENSPVVSFGRVKRYRKRRIIVKYPGQSSSQSIHSDQSPEQSIGRNSQRKVTKKARESSHRGKENVPSQTFIKCKIYKNGCREANKKRKKIFSESEEEDTRIVKRKRIWIQSSSSSNQRSLEKSQSDAEVDMAIEKQPTSDKNYENEIKLKNAQRWTKILGMGDCEREDEIVQPSSLEPELMQSSSQNGLPSGISSPIKFIGMTMDVDSYGSEKDEMVTNNMEEDGPVSTNPREVYNEWINYLKFGKLSEELTTMKESGEFDGEKEPSPAWRISEHEMEGVYEPPTEESSIYNSQSSGTEMGDMETPKKLCKNYTHSDKFNSSDASD